MQSEHRFGSRQRGSVATVLLTVMSAATVLAIDAGSASGQETPAQHCARETSAYNAAWESSWRATNPGNPGQPPPPPVPYVCVDPGSPTTTTTTPPPTAPGLAPSQAPGGGVRGQAGNAPGRLPDGDGTDIVPGPTTAPRSFAESSAPTASFVPSAVPAVPDPMRPNPVTPPGTGSPTPPAIREVKDDKVTAPESPPADEGPAANGCESCNKDSQTGFILPGPVGPVPSAGDRWSGGDRYLNHWVIDKVDKQGEVIPPGDRALLGECVPKDGSSGYAGTSGFDVAWSDQSVNLTQNSWTVGGKGSAGGNAGPVELGGEVNGSYTRSTSTSSSKSLTTTGHVNCADYPPPPAGTVLKFYQGYQQLSWTGRWQQYRCSIFGCEKIKEEQVRGVYFAPLPTALGRPEPL